MKKLIFIYLCSWTLIAHNCESPNWYSEDASICKVESFEKNLFIRSESINVSLRDFLSVSLPAIISADPNCRQVNQNDFSNRISALQVKSEYLFLNFRSLRI